jgi:hypothetical protein
MIQSSNAVLKEAAGRSVRAENVNKVSFIKFATVQELQPVFKSTSYYDVDFYKIETVILT